MSTKVTIFFALLGMAFAAPQYGSIQPQQPFPIPTVQQAYQQPSVQQPQQSYQQPSAQPQQTYQQPAATAPPQPSYQRPAASQQAYQEPAPGPASYDFDWSVKDDYSGNDFGQTESRDGYNTQGSYYVLLPDTRLMKVTYSVSGDSGFVADVSFEGEAQYPQASNVYQQPQPKPSNAYSQPQSNQYN